jgi:hypothetical protein
MCENGTVRPVETVLRRQGAGIKEKDEGVEGVNIIEIYCKHLHKCHNVPPVLIKILKVKAKKRNCHSSIYQRERERDRERNGYSDVCGESLLQEYSVLFIIA